jgi:ATP-dependent DNA helicase RecG
MRTSHDIEKLLPELEMRIADELEDQDLDFKAWDLDSRKNAIKKVVSMAVCMANGGGGTVVFGVADKVIGRNNAVLGVPEDIDINILKKSVYDQTDPKITPVFEELWVPEGTGRLIIMQTYPGFPPYTDNSGRGTIRIGKDCQPLTGTIRKKIAVETGETDYTAECVAKVDESLLSAVALENLRNQAKAEKAPDELLALSDIELLNSLGLITKNKFSRAVILLAGNEEAIKKYVPGYEWTFLKMDGDSDYSVREDRASAIMASVTRIEELILPFNPITTIKQGLFHYEYRIWPTIAIREALMNAFCHVDLRIAGPVMVKLYADKIEISNLGGFIGGITSDNILHHQPAARNPLLVGALAKLRLINRTNLGVNRMYAAMLVEGKEAPIIREIGESVTVTFFKQDIDAVFRMFVKETSDKGIYLNVDDLLLLWYLRENTEIDTQDAAKLCQRDENEIRKRLTDLMRHGFVEHGGKGRGAYWCMDPALYKKISNKDDLEKRSRIDWEAAKTRILSVLMERARRGEQGLKSKEIRQITRFDRSQAHRLMQQLMSENEAVKLTGRGPGTVYVYEKGVNN